MGGADKFFDEAFERFALKSDAELLGIDLRELVKERFGGRAHWLMLEKHRANKRRWHSSQEWMSKRERMAAKRVERFEEKLSNIAEPDEKYSFTDAQMAIAMRSLGVAS